MKKSLTVIAMFGICISACGGKGGSAGSAATSKTFTYNAPSAASSSEAGSLNSVVSAGTAQNASLNASEATSFVDFSSTTSALLGPSGATFSITPTDGSARLVHGRELVRQAMDGSGNSFDNPACSTTATNKVTLTGCVLTISQGTQKTVIHADGFVQGGSGAVSWDLTVKIAFTDSGSTDNVAATLHESGNLTVTSTTVKGQMVGDVSVSGTVKGQVQSIAVSESLTIDTTYQAGPPACVTSGTVEAKRVWTTRPSGSTAAQYPDKGAKVTWTGCGVASVAHSQ